MSHFTVLVVLPKETPLEAVDGEEGALGRVLEPWNENTEVEEYRKYLDDTTPEDHWQYRYVYADALPSAVDPAPRTTWEQYVVDLNRHNGDDDERYHYDPETGRAYTVSTYNPDSKWDWWQVGGRYSNMLLAKPTVDLSALLWSPSHWTEEFGNTIPKGRDDNGRFHCNGGRLMDIDLEAMRAAKVAQATDAYDRFAECIGDLLATTKPWVHFHGLAQAGVYDEEVAALNATFKEDDPVPQDVLGLVGTRGQRQVFPRDIARREYNAQPGIVRLNEREEYRHFFGCVVDEFKLGREAYIAREADNFLPGYAMVTLDGEWRACGEMGWFGMGSDEDGTVDAHKADMMAYLKSLDPESIIVVVDCHI